MELAHLMPKYVEGVLNFAMFPLHGLRVPGFKIDTMEDIQALAPFIIVFPFPINSNMCSIELFSYSSIGKCLASGNPVTLIFALFSNLSFHSSPLSKGQTLSFIP